MCSLRLLLTHAPAVTLCTHVTIHVLYTSSLDPRPVAWLLLAIACGLVGLVEAGRLDGHSRLVPQVLAQVLASVRWSAVGGRLRGMDAAGRDQTYRKSLIPLCS